MNDAEIVAGLKKANALIDEYKRIVEPIAQELADRKSIQLFGEKGRYRGDLGCYETGITELCMHIDRDSPKHSGIAREDLLDKSREYSDYWNAKLLENNIVNISVLGFF